MSIKDWLRQQELGRDVLQRQRDVAIGNLPGTRFDGLPGVANGPVAAILTDLDAAQDALDYTKRALTGANLALAGKADQFFNDTELGRKLAPTTLALLPTPLAPLTGIALGDDLARHTPLPDPLALGPLGREDLAAARRRYETTPGNPVHRAREANEGAAAVSPFAVGAVNEAADISNFFGPLGKGTQATKLGRLGDVLVAADRAPHPQRR